MKSHAHTQPHSRIVLKLISLIIGYGIWSTISIEQITTVRTTVPLYFYNHPHDTQVDAPENIKVELSGKRADLYTVDYATCAAHINLAEKKQGKHTLVVRNNNFFLPQGVTVVRTQPGTVTVVLHNTPLAVGHNA